MSNKQHVPLCACLCRVCVGGGGGGKGREGGHPNAILYNGFADHAVSNMSLCKNRFAYNFQYADMYSTAAS